MLEFAQTLAVPENGRVVKAVVSGKSYYFVTNQYSLSHLLATTIFGLINNMSGAELEMFARDNLGIDIQSSNPPLKINDCATIVQHKKTSEYHLTLL